MNEYLQGNGIVAVRVDDRLIHGIVATMWIPQIHATRAMVVNDDAANSQITRSTLKMSTPGGVALSVLTVQKAVSNINNGNYLEQRVFVIGGRIEDIFRLYQANVKFERVNLGNVTQNSGEVFVLDKTVRVSKEEKAMLRTMRDGGVLITCQFRPDGPCKVLQDILD